MRTIAVMLLLCGLSVGVAGGAAEAAEIKVLTAGAMREWWWRCCGFREADRS